MSVFKIINGPNDSREYLEGIYKYITDFTKTGQGLYIAEKGCSHNDPIKDMISAKRLHHKTHGKQGIQFVLSFTPCSPDIPNEKYMEATGEIIDRIYPQFQSVYALHLDSVNKHTHTILNAVNMITGNKFSQSAGDLNKVKQIINSVLDEYGFDIITGSANDFIDNSSYIEAEDYNYLELNETKSIKTSDMNTITAADVSDTYDDDDYYSYDGYPFQAPFHMEENIMNKNYPLFEAQEETHPTTVNNAQICAVPTDVNIAATTTTIVTGPTIKIYGAPTTNLRDLSEIIEKTTLDAREHQLQSANLALALNMKAQESGHPTNVCIMSGPVFDIDLTGSYGYNVCEEEDFSDIS